MVDKKVALVTGGNKGIGYETVRALCKKLPDWVVILTARNSQAGEEAVKKLAKENLKATHLQLDITKQESVEALRDQLKSTYGGLDILVNNAGFAFKQAATEGVAEQADVTVGVNYYGTARACKLLFPLLRSGARVVNVASSVATMPATNAAMWKKLGQRDFVKDPSVIEALAREYLESTTSPSHASNGWPTTTYGASKFLVLMLSEHLALTKKPDAHDYLVNACCPGWCRTDMAGDQATRSAEEGADTLVYLATLPPDNGLNGKFVRDREEVEWRQSKV
eukprot:GHVU01132985.1.p1 GENE.GHVU01132985.1~~GHVU01132985.1.p1  ORF type:complete len:290 (-),score=60.25 GHVU01132985.1:396-1235(-)